MSDRIEKLLTIEEVADILRVSTRTIVRYIECGKLKASKIGVWRIKESDVHLFLEETSNKKNYGIKKITTL
ncbi:MAG: helix-turn-helix domain-containing protein [Bacteroidales bacterium]|nr:helix-turn-helix domain-containing protein [Bacteroidales bacterium]